MSFGYLDDLKIIEHSTLKVPYETLNKQYRNVQKSIDRDCSSLNQAMLSIEKLAKSDMLNKNDLMTSFMNLVDKLRMLKKRSAEFKREENELLELIKRRIGHLKDCQSESSSVVKNFRKVRVERILIDYFLRSSLYETAQLLASKSSIDVNERALSFLSFCYI
jgi:macrophage erythroblast attacher